MIQTDSLTIFLKYSENLGIWFYIVLPTSNITFFEDEVFFDENGYFDPSGVMWKREMAKQRVAD
jgi:hypothetical protein